MPMLISIVLALISERDGVLPAELGRANHALTLERLSEREPALVERLHAGDGPKPITCSGLLGLPPEPGNVTVAAGRRYAVRVTGLTDEVSAALEAALVRERPAGWPLHGQPFRVLEATCDAGQEAWSGRSSYQELAAAGLAAAERGARSVTLEFASPTAFRSHELQVPIPMPALTFGSLAERWNAFGGITLGAEMRQFAEEGVAINRYVLESRPAPHKNGALRIGGVGRVKYEVVGREPYWAAALQILASFALYSGVGVQTTTGMGQCRRV